jgi:hypothetical protein
MTVSAVAHPVIMVGDLWSGFQWASEDAATVQAARGVLTNGYTHLFDRWGRSCAMLLRLPSSFASWWQWCFRVP